MRSHPRFATVLVLLAVGLVVWPALARGQGPDKTVLVPLKANDLVYDATRGLFYAAVADNAPAHANTIAALDPKDGKVVWTADVGKNPMVLALSGDAKGLWVGLRGASSLQRVDLEQRRAGAEVALQKGLFVETMVVLPGTTDLVVASLQNVGLSPRHAGVWVYDNGKALAKKTQGHTGSNRLAATDTPNEVFGYNNETTEFGLRRIHVDADGAKEGKVYQGVLGLFGLDITFGGGRIYATNGAVIDAKEGKLVGKLPVAGPVVHDGGRRRVYVLALNEGKVVACDTEKLTRVADFAVQVPGVQTARKLVLAGGVALAFRTDSQVVIVPLRALEK